MTDLVMLGGGGHARSVFAALNLGNLVLRGYVAPEQGALSPQLRYLGGDDALERLDPMLVRVINGVGSVGSTAMRKSLYERVCGLGFRFTSVIHTHAFVDPAAKLGEGVQILAGSIVNVGAEIGDDAIVNSGAVVEHDAIIGAHAHVSPGAVVAGAVWLEDGVHLGLGARVIQGVRVGTGSVVGAGAVVLRDVPPHTTVVGVPAHVLGRGGQENA